MSNNISAIFELAINNITKTQGMDFEEIKRQIDSLMHERNNTGLSDFEGYSPSEMHYIMNFLFMKECPVKLNALDAGDLEKIPMLNQIKFLMQLVAGAGELKLTKLGSLPVKVVSEIYRQGFLKEEYIEKGWIKLYKESDSHTITLTRILIELAGVAKKRNGKLSLTKTGNVLLADDNGLLQRILTAFTTRFNWAYFDRYGNTPIGRVGCGFSFILLSKYGNERRLDSFYADKYFKAYPDMIQTVESNFNDDREAAISCYNLRTFERFLDHFGLIRQEREGELYERIIYITKTDVFDKLISCKPPQNV